MTPTALLASLYPGESLDLSPAVGITRVLEPKMCPFLTKPSPQMSPLFAQVPTHLTNIHLHFQFFLWPIILVEVKPREVHESVHLLYLLFH
jgi:hypothetical protein